MFLACLVAAQDSAQSDNGWKTSVNGYVWVGTRYYGGIANASFDERSVLQGGVNFVLLKKNTSVVIKTWYSLSPEQDGAGKRWTGNAQEFDLGADVVQELGHGFTVKAGYSHFFITKEAGSDVEMLALVLTKAAALTEHGKLVGSFEFYQFFPSSSKGPAAGRFYMPSVSYVYTRGKWSVSGAVAGAFNSGGVFGFKAEPAIKVTVQTLYKLSKGATGPDVTYGGVPGSKERPMGTTVGWSWVF